MDHPIQPPTFPPFSDKKKSLLKKTRMIAMGIMMLFLTVGLATAAYLAQVNQDVRQDASGGGWCTGQEQCPPGWNWGGGADYCEANQRYCTQGGVAGGGDSAANSGTTTGAATATAACPSGWTCNGHCADTAATTIFQNTWQDGRARWLWEAAGNSASCGGNESSLKSTAVAQAPAPGTGGGTDAVAASNLCVDSAPTASACRGGVAIGDPCRGFDGQCVVSPDAAGTKYCACIANTKVGVGAACSADSSCSSGKCNPTTKKCVAECYENAHCSSKSCNVATGQCQATASDTTSTTTSNSTATKLTACKDASGKTRSEGDSWCDENKVYICSNSQPQVGKTCTSTQVCKDGQCIAQATNSVTSTGGQTAAATEQRCPFRTVLGPVTIEPGMIVCDGNVLKVSTGKTAQMDVRLNCAANGGTCDSGTSPHRCVNPTERAVTKTCWSMSDFFGVYRCTSQTTSSTSCPSSYPYSSESSCLDRASQVARENGGTYISSTGQTVDPNPSNKTCSQLTTQECAATAAERARCMVGAGGACENRRTVTRTCWTVTEQNRAYRCNSQNTTDTSCGASYPFTTLSTCLARAQQLAQENTGSYVTANGQVIELNLAGKTCSQLTTQECAFTAAERARCVVGAGGKCEDRRSSSRTCWSMSDFFGVYRCTSQTTTNTSCAGSYPFAAESTCLARAAQVAQENNGSYVNSAGQTVSMNIADRTCSQLSIAECSATVAERARCVIGSSGRCENKPAVSRSCWKLTSRNTNRQPIFQCETQTVNTVNCAGDYPYASQSSCQTEAERRATAEGGYYVNSSGQQIAAQTMPVNLRTCEQLNTTECLTQMSRCAMSGLSCQTKTGQATEITTQAQNPGSCASLNVSLCTASPRCEILPADLRAGRFTATCREKANISEYEVAVAQAVASRITCWGVTTGTPITCRSQVFTNVGTCLETNTHPYAERELCMGVAQTRAQETGGSVAQPLPAARPSCPAGTTTNFDTNTGAVTCRCSSGTVIAPTGSCTAAVVPVETPAPRCPVATNFLASLNCTRSRNTFNWSTCSCEISPTNTCYQLETVAGSWQCRSLGAQQNCTGYPLYLSEAACSIALQRLAGVDETTTEIVANPVAPATQTLTATPVEVTMTSCYNLNNENGRWTCVQYPDFVPGNCSGYGFYEGRTAASDCAAARRAMTGESAQTVGESAAQAQVAATSQTTGFSFNGRSYSCSAATYAVRLVSCSRTQGTLNQNCECVPPAGSCTNDAGRMVRDGSQYCINGQVAQLARCTNGVAVISNLCQYGCRESGSTASCNPTPQTPNRINCILTQTTNLISQCGLLNIDYANCTCKTTAPATPAVPAESVTAPAVPQAPVLTDYDAEARQYRRDNPHMIRLSSYQGALSVMAVQQRSMLDVAYWRDTFDRLTPEQQEAVLDYDLRVVR